MYLIGKWFGHRILAAGRIPFIPPEAVRTVARVVRAVRVLAHHREPVPLPGTRAVVAFFAGMSDLKLGPTIALSFVSALFWNAILVTSGYVLGNNWERIGFYLSTYSQVVTGVVVLVVIVLVIRYFSTRNGRQGSP